MIPLRFDYHRATSIVDAIEALDAAGEAARPLAGGQSLVPLLKLRLAEPSLLVDLGSIPGLDTIEVEDTTVRLGALVTHDDMLRTVAPLTGINAVTDAALGIGDRQVRSWGSVAGSLAHADPASDWPAVAVSLDWLIHTQSPAGERTISADAFFESAFSTALEIGEIVTGITLKRYHPTATAYCKIADPASGYARAGVATAITSYGDGTASPRIVATGIATAPIRLSAVEEALANGAPAAAAAVLAGSKDIGESNNHHIGRYQRQLLVVATERSVTAATSRANQNEPEMRDPKREAEK